MAAPYFSGGDYTPTMQNRWCYLLRYPDSLQANMINHNYKTVAESFSGLNNAWNNLRGVDLRNLATS